MVSLQAGPKSCTAASDKKKAGKKTGPSASYRNNFKTFSLETIELFGEHNPLTGWPETLYRERNLRFGHSSRGTGPMRESYLVKVDLSPVQIVSARATSLGAFFVI